MFCCIKSKPLARGGRVFSAAVSKPVLSPVEGGARWVRRSQTHRHCWVHRTCGRRPFYGPLPLAAAGFQAFAVGVGSGSSRIVSRPASAALRKMLFSQPPHTATESAIPKPTAVRMMRAYHEVPMWQSRVRRARRPVAEPGEKE